MEKVVVDTDIIIDFLRTNKGLLPRLRQLQEKGVLEIYISSVTIVELFTGDMRRTQEKMLSDLLVNFKVIPFDEEIAKFAGEAKRGKRLQIQLSDFIIGITSIYFKADLATRNKDHFQGMKGIKFWKLAF
ncbi:PIN domain-containing protein [Candidatus Gottesmanbacteria bacterium]|nr:PIN domain-containing protein [Candidatus Gottesmanbacteria bacterium]